MRNRLLGLLVLILCNFVLKAQQQQVIQPQRAWILQNFQPPQDTIIEPIRLGELRSRTADTSVYISISLTGKKWYKISGSGSLGLADGNNYVSAINYNTGNGLFTLSRVGLPNLTTSIPIPTYNGSETIVQGGTGGISVTGIGTTGNPYVINGTLDGNNYPTAMSYINGILSLDRNGLTQLTVPIPVGDNNYPTSLSMSGNTLILGRNGLSNLTTIIPQDGNNFPVSMTYGNSILTLNRSGLTPITVTIPAVDTNILATKAWRQKGDDSLGALTKARVFISGDTSISITRRTGLLADTIDIRSADTLVQTTFISSDGTVTIDYIEGSTGDTIDLGVEVGQGAIDTTVLSTKNNVQKHIDSLGALTKARYYFSSDGSIGVTRKFGTLQDSIDIVSLDTTVSTLIVSGDNSVSIDYRQGELEDTFDLRVTIPEGAGDNWGSQFAYTDGTLLGNGLITNRLAIDTNSMFFTSYKTRKYIADSVITLYKGDGAIASNRTVSLGANQIKFLTTNNTEVSFDQVNGFQYNRNTPLQPKYFKIDSTGLTYSFSKVGDIYQSSFFAGPKFFILPSYGSPAYTGDDSINSVQLSAYSFKDGVTGVGMIKTDGFVAQMNARDSVVFGTHFTNHPVPAVGYIRWRPITGPLQLTHKIYVDSSVNTRHLKVLYQDEGVSLGTSGTVNLINFTGAGVTASRAGDILTVNIPGGGGGGGTGTVTSVGLTMPAAFGVTGSPVTTAGTLAVTALGNSTQYIRGDGVLATFPTIPTYNGSETKVNAGANITVTGTGTIASPYVVSGNAGTVTSVGLSAPSAFTVLNSPVTGSGTLQLVGAGTTGQYIRGDGSLAPFPTIPTYDGSETKLQAGSNVTITGTGTTLDPYIVSSTGGGGGSGTVTSVGLTAFSGISVSNSPITTSGNIALSTTLNGILYGTGSGFAAGTVTSPLVFSGGSLSMTQAGTSSNGWLSSGNWNTFNSKQQPLQFQDEWVNLGTSGSTSRINFIGAGVSAVDSSGTIKVTIPGAVGDGNNYVTGASISGGVLTINRSGLSNITTSFTTTAVPEGTNQYFTQARARTSISLTTLGNSGASTYNNTTGVLNVPEYTLSGLGGEPLIAGGTALQYWNGLKQWVTLNTSVVPESGNLYFTNLRARQAISLTTLGNSGASTYNNSTGVLNVPNYTLAGLGGEPIITAPYLPNRYWNGYKQFVVFNTDSIPEGSINQYFTIERVHQALNATAPITYNNLTGLIGITQSSPASNGYLSSGDWLQFYNKQDAIQFKDEGSNLGTFKTVTEINFTGGGITTTRLGNALTVNVPSSTNVQYQDEGVNTGTAGGVGTLNFTGAGVTSTFNAGVLTVAIPGGVGADGNNFPTSITTASGLITIARSGLTSISDSLSTTRVVEGSNLYFTNARARSAISLTTTGSSGASTYNSSTGVLNVPNYTLTGLGGVPTTRTLTINGVTQDLSANRTWSVGTVTSVAALTIGTAGSDINSTVANSTTTPVITLNVPTASGTNRGALSSTDWTTFNNKQDPITLTTTGTSGPATFIGDVLNVPNYTLAGLGGVPLSRTITINGVAQDLTANRTWSVGTVTSVGLIAGTSGTDISVSGSPVTGSGSLTINIPTASSVNRGALSSSDWTKFNNKQNQLTVTTVGNSGPAVFTTKVGSTTADSLNIPNYTLTGLGGVPTSRTITINGVAQDLTANRTWNVGTVTSVGATGGTGISVTGSPITTSGSFTITNTAPDQVVSITGVGGISVTGTYPNFTVSGTSITGLYAQSSTLTAASGYDFALVKDVAGAYVSSNKIMQVGHVTNPALRTVTIDATLYIATASFSLGSWVHVATVPVGYRPYGLTTFPIAHAVPGTGNPLTTPIRSSGSVGITNGALYTAASGYIDPNTGFVYVNIPSVSSSASLGGSPTVLIPLVVTYFMYPND